MCSFFYSLTSLRVNVSFSVSSCRRRGNLQGGIGRAHGLPGSRHPTRAVTSHYCVKPRGHHQRAERPRCRGGGYVGPGWHGIRPAGRSRHGAAVAGHFEMMCWRRQPVWTGVAVGGQIVKTCMNWGICPSCHPWLRYSHTFIADDNQTMTWRSASISLHHDGEVCSFYVCKYEEPVSKSVCRICVGGISRSLVIVGNGLRLGLKHLN